MSERQKINSTSNRERPGAMTMAMRAVDLPSPGPRSLRVGLVREGRIIQEKVFDPGASVSIGSSEKADFVLSAEDCPPRFELLQPVSGGYALNFTDAMGGRVALPSGAHDLESLTTAGAARNAGQHWQIKLNEASRGKIILGQTSLLFQFVVVPPVQPAPQLPVAVRGAFFRNIDWTFTAFIVVSYMLFLGTVIFLENYDFPLSDTEARVPDAYARLIFQEPEPPAPVADEEPEPMDGDGSDEVVEVAQEEGKKDTSDTVKAAQGVDAAAASSAEVRSRIADEVAAKAESMLLGALGDGGALSNVLAGGAVTANAADVLAQASGVGVASGGSGALRTREGGGGSGAAGDLGSLKGAGGQGATKSASEGKAVTERAVKGNIKLERGGDVGGSGDFDAAKVVAAIKLRLRAIQSCYENELKRDPTIAGKVTVTFTIQQAGTVSGASATENTSGSAGLASCVVKTVQRFRFTPGPSGGSVTFSYPFVFAPQR